MLLASVLFAEQCHHAHCLRGPPIRGSSPEPVDWSQVPALSSDFPLPAGPPPVVVLTSLGLGFRICYMGTIRTSAHSEHAVE